jgi:hypothetical protein
MKEFDNWRVGDPRQSMREWKRPMTAKTIRARFDVTQIAMIEDALNDMNGTKLGSVTVYCASIPESHCPECGTHNVVHSFTLASGDVVYWPHCAGHAKDQNHGFGRFSKHGNRSPSGRRQREPGEPVAATEPEPVTESEPPKAVEVPAVPAKVRHERFNDVLRLYKAGVRAFLLEGPAGSGKTSLAADLAEALGIAYYSVNGNKYTDMGELTKFRNPHNGVEKIASFMAGLVGAPGVGCIDEGDGIPPDVLLSMNEPSANGRLTINGEVVRLNPDSVLIMTANATDGTSRVYTGRYPMDGATKSRFLPVYCDYSDAIEAVVCQDRTLRTAVTEVRKRVNNDPQLARTFAAMVGTRLLIQASHVGRAFGLTGRDALRKTLEIGHPADVVGQLIG